MKKIVFVFLLFFIVMLLQTGFLPHFLLLGFVPNILISALLFFAIFEPYNAKTAFFAAFFAGFFLDIFSQGFFGFWVIACFIGVFIVKFFKRTYVRVPLR